MAGGYQSLIPPLRIGGVPTAGFRNPLTPLGFYAVPVAGNAGFLGIIPVVPVGAETPVGGDAGGRRRRTYFTMIGRTRLGR